MTAVTPPIPILRAVTTIEHVPQIKETVGEEGNTITMITSTTRMMMRMQARVIYTRAKQLEGAGQGRPMRMRSSRRCIGRSPSSKAVLGVE